MICVELGIPADKCIALLDVYKNELDLSCPGATV
jgi:hypothetical protein